MDIDNSEVDLITQFRTMNTNDKDYLIAEFKRLSNTQLTNEGCCFYLDMAEWNLNTALWAYYEYDAPVDILNNNLPQMKFISDITIGEGESVAPNTNFIKTWRIKNTGGRRWPFGCQLKLVNTNLSRTEPGSNSIQVNALDAEEVSDISIELKSPEQCGIYQSQYRLFTPNNTPFGDPIWLVLNVEPGGVLGITQQLNSVSMFGANGGSNTTNNFNNNNNRNVLSLYSSSSVLGSVSGSGSSSSSSSTSNSSSLASPNSNIKSNTFNLPTIFNNNNKSPTTTNGILHHQHQHQQQQQQSYQTQFQTNNNNNNNNFNFNNNLVQPINTPTLINSSSPSFNNNNNSLSLFQSSFNQNGFNSDHSIKQSSEDITTSLNTTNIIANTNTTATANGIQNNLNQIVEDEKRPDFYDDMFS